MLKIKPQRTQKECELQFQAMLCSSGQGLLVATVRVLSAPLPLVLSWPPSRQAFSYHSTEISSAYLWHLHSVWYTWNTVLAGIPGHHTTGALLPHCVSKFPLLEPPSRCHLNPAMCSGAQSSFVCCLDHHSLVKQLPWRLRLGSHLRANDPECSSLAPASLLSSNCSPWPNRQLKINMLNTEHLVSIEPHLRKPPPAFLVSVNTSTSPLVGCSAPQILPSSSTPVFPSDCTSNPIDNFCRLHLPSISLSCPFRPLSAFHSGPGHLVSWLSACISPPPGFPATTSPYRVL